MASPHNAANLGDIAERVLLPGDPLRAKYIAENFLDSARKYTDIRNVYGYTGTYKGVPVSVQATGMGIPSFAIYVQELLDVYKVKKLIRVGTCGGMHVDVKVRDVLIAQGASTDSSIVHQVFGGAITYAPIADYDLLRRAVANAEKLGCNVKVGNIFCTDRFYNDYGDPNGIFGDGKRSLNQKMVQYGILAVEMETTALYVLAAGAGAKALAVFTVSDHLVTHEETTPEERETSFNDMIKIALETAVDD